MIHLRQDFTSQWRTIMPLAHIALRRGKPVAYRQAILDGVYAA
jgi:hypothetical protein